MSLSFSPALIFIFPFAFALLTPIAGKTTRRCQMFALIATACSLLFSLKGLFLVRSGQSITQYMGGWQPPFGIEWYFDSLSAFMCILISALSFLIFFATGAGVQKEIKNGPVPFYTTALLNLAGLLGMLLTRDLFNLFVFLEVSSLTTYALVATGDPYRGNIASFRYLCVGTVGASFYLLGVGYLYSATGTLNLSDMAARLPNVAASHSVLLGFFLIFVGVAIKSGLFPFHGWLPDAYANASNPASSLIAPLATKVAIYVMIRIFYVLGTSVTLGPTLFKILLGLGMLAVLVGSVFAFMQTHFRRMLAYSSVSHIGLIMIGIGLHHPIALVGALLHILHHAVMKASLFLMAGEVDQKYQITDLSDFKKLRGQMPWTMRVLALSSLSMIGIPPLCGFFSKWYILIGAFQTKQIAVIVVILFSSLLTALYFFKFLEIVFFQPLAIDQPKTEGNSRAFYVYGGLSLSLFVLGFYAPTLFRWGMKVFTEFPL